MFNRPGLKLRGASAASSLAVTRGEARNSNAYLTRGGFELNVAHSGRSASFSRFRGDSSFLGKRDSLNN